jgi:hypothetical protein
VKAEVERRAKDDGVSINQFVATAVAEKLAAMNTVASSLNGGSVQILLRSTA